EDVYTPDNSSETQAEDETESASVDDPKAAFTVTGTPRAQSEARRLWNHVCPIEGCGKRFNRPCRLETHMRSHTKERPFACPHNECDKTFLRNEHLQRHLNSAHSTNRKYLCGWDGCGKGFATRERLRRHQEAHEVKETKRCKDYPPCNKTFRKHSTLEAHIRTEHLNAKAFPCTHIDEKTGQRCTNGYDSANNLRRHIGHAHGGDRYICATCSYPETVDTDEGLSSPPIDPVTFPTYTDLRVHVMERHPPICRACGLKCASQATLKAHIEIAHEPPPGGLRKYPCPYPDCDRVFTRNGNLKVHIKSVHKNLRNFICGLFDVLESNKPDVKAWNGEGACGFAASTKSTLEQHIQTQHLNLTNRKQQRKAAKAKKRVEPPSLIQLLTGVGYEERRPIPCLIPDCEIRFMRDYDLRQHLRAAHHLLPETIDEMVMERDALQGGHFWVGGYEE
ncbi:hypothetical protein K469DRAFT_481390, partial [Zopfia rhizophila CBS 207.26]